MQPKDRLAVNLGHKDRAAHHVLKWKRAVYFLAIVAGIMAIIYIIFMYQVAKSFQS